jgi:hypothetical protein
VLGRPQFKSGTLGWGGRALLCTCKTLDSVTSSMTEGGEREGRKEGEREEERNSQEW